MRVLVCDDHSLFREGLRLLLEKLDASMEVTLTGSAEEAVAATKDGTFDLILMDWHMEGLAGTHALEALRESAPLTRVVVLSGDRNAELVRSAIDFGAAGFIPKDSPPAQLMTAVKTIADGGVYLPTGALAPIQTRDVRDAFPTLTERQADVLRAALRGNSNKLIARQLGISDGTVKTHLRAIYQELGTRNRTEAVYMAAEQGVRIS
ncbi:response regulator transcription factor [Ramlibacter sp. USB13]|uniref:Response regulator transcription factor n=1 Tax=Ramlibacter cellulosilyticus TaxID=2764187 RepID=A0A923MVX1_9BURK|nr:response regulator transcription factor [Ramlibacter cellulosilyticus]MBC5786021.1 response regulator transcription factor [Ramlibacter cellulosilyticus]